MKSFDFFGCATKLLVGEVLPNMKAVHTATIVAFAARALAHGYVYRITADNTMYEPAIGVLTRPELPFC